MNPIDAKTSMIINIVAAILTGIAAGAVSFKGLVAPETATQITGWSAVFAFVISCVNVGLHGYSSPGAGPMVSGPPVPPPGGKLAAFLLAIGLAAVASGWSSPASAQAKRPALTGNIPADIANAANPGKPTGRDSPLDALAPNIRKLSLDDFKYAAALAHASANTVPPPSLAPWDIRLLQPLHPLNSRSDLTMP